MNTTAAARAPSGNYFYRLVVYPEALATRDYSCFKLRSSGQASLLPGVFTVMAGPVSPADFNLVFPSFPTLTPRTYDGVWQFYAWIGEPQTMLEFWDGDFDFGDYQDIDLDTNDPNTTGIPPWAGGGAVAEGAKGQGDPQDDNSNAYLTEDRLHSVFGQFDDRLGDISELDTAITTNGVMVGLLNNQGIFKTLLQGIYYRNII